MTARGQLVNGFLFLWALVLLLTMKLFGFNASGGAAIPPISVPLLFLPVLPYLVARWIWGRQLRDLPPVPLDVTTRLACVGSPRQLKKCGEFTDLPFAPVFFSATFAQPFSWVMVMVAVVPAIPAIVGCQYLIAHLAGTPILEFTMMTNVFAGSGGVGCAAGIVGWLWPTYFRIVPGRLDVMRFNNLLNRPVSVERYNLRTAKLLIDLRRGVIFVDESDGRTGEFPIVWMRRSTRERLAYHLLLAAISSYEAPMLPDDRLLG